MKNFETLKKQIDFSRVYKKGKRLNTRFFRLFIIIKDNSEVLRLGISVNKKVGKAVTRNRIRRRVKDIFRTVSKETGKGFDILFVAREGVDLVKYSELKDSILNKIYPLLSKTL